MDSTTPPQHVAGISMRAARPADYDRVVGCVDEWWGRPISRGLPRLFLDHFHGTSLIAEDAGSLAGFLVGFLSPSLHEAAYIHFVGVDPRLRGRGLARSLYDGFFALAAADGRSVVKAITAPVNTGSIAFHTAMGSTVTGPVPDYDGPGADMMVFERRLG